MFVRVVLVCLVAVVCGAGSAVAAPDAPVSGAGSTGPAALVESWRVAARGSGLRVSYAATGATDGRNQFRRDQVRFAVTELPYGLSEVDDPVPDRPFDYVPVAADALAAGHRLPVDLRLSEEALAGIFTGTITDWSDPAVAAANPGVALPALPVVPLVRSDGNADTLQFTTWLAARFPDRWNDLCARAERSVPCAPTQFFPLLPGFRSVAGALGVANALRALPGAIGLAPQAYLRNAGVPVAALRNPAGQYTRPSAESVSAALGSTVVPAGGVAGFGAAHAEQDPRSYPLSRLTYAVVPTGVTAATTAAHGEAVAAFFRFGVCEGRSAVEAAGYVALGPDLARAAVARLGRVPGARVEPCADGPAGESITTEVLPGELLLSVEPGEVVLPSPVPTADGARLVTSGALRPVRVTDTRAGSPGWSLSGQVTDFRSALGEVIDGANLGWSPRVLDRSPTQSLVEGAVVPPAPAVLPGAPVPDGSGLRDSRVLASTPHGSGTAVLTADLTLHAPTSTKAGGYAAVLTITVI